MADLAMAALSRTRSTCRTLATSFDIQQPVSFTATATVALFLWHGGVALKIGAHTWNQL